MQNPKVFKIEISAKTIIFTVFFILFLFVLWTIRDLLISLFLAFIIMSTVKPLISKLQKMGVPRQFSIMSVFLIVIALFIGGSFWIFPPLIYETGMLVRHLPSMLRAINPQLVEFFDLNSVFQYAPSITNQVFEILKSFFSNVAFFTTTIFFSIYFTSDEMFLQNILGRIFSQEETLRIVDVVEKTEKRLGSWLLGELLLMMIVGGLTYVGLSLLGVRYALSLSIIAGLLEIVPNIGPILSTVPAFIVAVAQSYFLGLASIALYFIVQQLENQIIVPFVMKKVIGLSPIITLIALIVGGRFFGVFGILLSIPFTLFLETVFHEVTHTEQR